MFVMALTRPSLTMQLTSGVDVFAHACEQKADTIVTIFSRMTRDVSVFVKCDTIFRLFLFKLPQFHTSNFRKVMRQHTEGMLGNITRILLEIYLAFQQWKNFEKSLNNRQSYCHEFDLGCIFVQGLMYYLLGHCLQGKVYSSCVRSCVTWEWNIACEKRK